MISPSKTILGKDILPNSRKKRKESKSLLNFYETQDSGGECKKFKKQKNFITKKQNQFICTFLNCEKKFRDNTDLLRHKKTHSNKKKNWKKRLHVSKIQMSSFELHANVCSRSLLFPTYFT